jgi:hypothetical protein
MRSHGWVIVALLGGFVGVANGADQTKVKFSECPEPVRKTLHAEAPGAKFDEVGKERDDGNEVTYWAKAELGGKMYSLGVLEDGTLSEMTLDIAEEDEIPLDKCPAAARATLLGEAFGVKIQNVIKDLKYGVAIYEVVVEHQGKMYEIVVAEDGTLVEKVLVIDDEDLELSACPLAVQAGIKKLAKGGTIDGVTRSSGIGKPTFEAEVEIKGRVYLIEVDDTGALIAKSLEATKE